MKALFFSILALAVLPAKAGAQDKPASATESACQEFYITDKVLRSACVSEARNGKHDVELARVFCAGLPDRLFVTCLGLARDRVLTDLDRPKAEACNDVFRSRRSVLTAEHNDCDRLHAAYRDVGALMQCQDKVEEKHRNNELDYFKCADRAYKRPATGEKKASGPNWEEILESAEAQSNPAS